MDREKNQTMKMLNTEKRKYQKLHKKIWFGERNVEKHLY